VVKQIALGPADCVEGQAVVAGLLLGQRPCAGPLDATQVGMGDHEAISWHASVVALLDDEVEHRLGVLSPDELITIQWYVCSGGTMCGPPWIGCR
jgi:hypothetical protein